MDTTDLEFSSGGQCLIRRNTMLAQVIGKHFGLIIQRRDEAKCIAAMLYTLAQRIDAWIISLHGIVHNDAVFTVDA